MIRLTDRLKKCLYNESLLDDEDMMLDNVDNEAYNNSIKNQNSPFRSSFMIVDMGTTKHIPADEVNTYVDNKSVNILNKYVLHCDDRKLSDFFPKRNELSIAGLLNITNGSDTLSKDTIADKVYCKSLRVSHKSVIKNLHMIVSDNIKFDKKSNIKIFAPDVCMFGDSINSKEFHNVFLKIENPKVKSLKISSIAIPIFDDFRCNCKKLSIYHPNIFKNSEKNLANLFEFPYKCDVLEYGIGRDLIIKNFKALEALAISRKYKLDCETAYKIKDDAKLTDFLNISNMPYLRCIEIFDSDCILQFDRGDKEYDFGNMLGMSKNVYTKDNWRVTIRKK